MGEQKPWRRRTKTYQVYDPRRGVLYESEFLDNAIEMKEKYEKQDRENPSITGNTHTYELMVKTEEWGPVKMEEIRRMDKKLK